MIVASNSFNNDVYQNADAPQSSGQKRLRSSSMPQEVKKIRMAIELPPEVEHIRQGIANLTISSPDEQKEVRAVASSRSYTYLNKLEERRSIEVVSKPKKTVRFVELVTHRQLRGSGDEQKIEQQIQLVDESMNVPSGVRGLNHTYRRLDPTLTEKYLSKREINLKVLAFLHSKGLA